MGQSVLRRNIRSGKERTSLSICLAEHYGSFNGFWPLLLRWLIDMGKRVATKARQDCTNDGVLRPTTDCGGVCTFFKKLLMKITIVYTFII